MSFFSRGSKAAPALASGAQTTSASLGESSSGRRFGELMIEAKLITAEQLEAALRLQTVSLRYMPIGQVLLANKLITRRQLNTMLHRYRKRSRLGDILVKSGRITAPQLDEALALQRRTPMPVGQALIRLGYLTEAEMRDALCTQLHINFFDLDPISVDQKLAKLISERFATRHGIVPLFRVDEVLVVAMDDPTQVALIETLQGNLGLHIETVTSTTQKIKDAIGRLYGPSLPPDVDVFSRRNILIGQIRDHSVAELVGKGLSGVAVLPPSWQ